MILHGDALEQLRLFGKDSIDLVVTDPPYEVDTSGAGIYNRREYHKELDSIADGFSPMVLDELCRVMKKINIYLFCSKRQIPFLLDYFVAQRGCNFNILTWHKTNPVPACANKYLTDTEFILFFREPGVQVYGEYSTKFTYYVTPLNKKDKELYGHPTVKPLHIVSNLILNSSKQGDAVLDPFCGSGTTLVAAEQLGRQGIGIELEGQYVEIAEARVTAAGRQTSLLDQNIADVS